MACRILAALLLAALAFGGPSRAQAAALPWTTIDFEAPAIAGASQDIAGDAYAALGVSFRTVRLSGSMARGAVVALAPVADGLRIHRDAGAISGWQSAGPALGGGYNDLLMEFAAPLSGIVLTSDDMVEAPNPIRLVALAATDLPDRFRVVDFVEAMDDAVEAPANRLSLAPPEPFSLALFEVRQQQEAFDDLAFAFAPADPGGTPDKPPAPPPGTQEIPLPPSLAMLAGAVAVAALGLQSATQARRGRMEGA